MHQVVLPEPILVAVGVPERSRGGEDRKTKRKKTNAKEGRKNRQLVVHVYTVTPVGEWVPRLPTGGRLRGSIPSGGWFFCDCAAESEKN